MNERQRNQYVVDELNKFLRKNGEYILISASSMFQTIIKAKATRTGKSRVLIFRKERADYGSGN